MDSERCVLVKPVIRDQATVRLRLVVLTYLMQRRARCSVQALVRLKLIPLLIASYVVWIVIALASHQLCALAWVAWRRR